MEGAAKPSLLSLSKAWETNPKQSFKMQFYDQAKVSVENVSVHTHLLACLLLQWLMIT